MTIEWAVLLSTVSVVAALIFNTMSASKQRKQEIQRDSREIAVIITKLDNLAAAIAEMRASLTNHDDDIKDNRELLVKVEEAAKSAHHRLDCLERKISAQH